MSFSFYLIGYRVFYALVCPYNKYKIFKSVSPTGKVRNRLLLYVIYRSFKNRLLQILPRIETKLWAAFLMDYVEKCRNRFGCYPRELFADQTYFTRIDCAALKEKGIKLKAKPLGRPPAVPNHVRPEERNPVEGKFGQAITAYGLNRIRARLQ
jgi:hypothetical protein